MFVIKSFKGYSTSCTNNRPICGHVLCVCDGAVYDHHSNCDVVLVELHDEVSHLSEDIDVVGGQIDDDEEVYVGLVTPDVRRQKTCWKDGDFLQKSEVNK